jgi:hypothetical protein
MFHDIRHATNPESYGVHRLWNELSELRPGVEFVGSEGLSLGIGVLTVCRRSRRGGYLRQGGVGRCRRVPLAFSRSLRSTPARD